EGVETERQDQVMDARRRCGGGTPVDDHADRASQARAPPARRSRREGQGARKRPAERAVTGPVVSRPGSLDPRRLAEVIARGRGTGYRVSGAAVVTAAHVVADADAIVLRFDADTASERSVGATVRWCDPDADIAVLQVDAPDGAAAVPLGRLADKAAFVSAETAGFPRWKARVGTSGETFRDLSHLEGSIP